MNDRAPLPSPVDLPPQLVAQATVSEAGGIDTLFVPGPPVKPAPRALDEPLPAAGPGVILMRLGDVQIGTLIVDSAARKVLGRVVKWNVSGSKVGGKALRRRIVIEVEEQEPEVQPAKKET